MQLIIDAWDSLGKADKDRLVAVVQKANNQFEPSDLRHLGANAHRCYPVKVRARRSHFMWLITNCAFFGIVEKPDDKAANSLTVRRRVRSDLESLRERYLPEMGEFQADQGTDYRYRAKVPRDSHAKAVIQIVLDIDYANFKTRLAGSRERHAHELMAA